MTSATHVLRRLLRHNNHRSISGIRSVPLIRQHYSTPSSPYDNPSPGFAGVRASTLSSPPCRPFGSPLTGVVCLSLFSSLAGEEEAEVLDMERGTVRCAANYVPLTPLSFIERAAAVYGDRPAVVYAGRRPTTWREVRERCVRVAAALATRFGVARGDVVSASALLWLAASIPSPPLCLLCPSVNVNRVVTCIFFSFLFLRMS